MVSGGDFYLVRDTEVHALCGRGHRTLDRKQPIYELAGRVRGERPSQNDWDDRTDDCGNFDYRIGDPNRVCRRRGYGLRHLPLNHVVRFHRAWDHSEKFDRFPNHLDVARAVSVERHCAACRVFYAASRILVAVIRGPAIAADYTGNNCRGVP